MYHVFTFPAKLKIFIILYIIVDYRSFYHSLISETINLIPILQTFQISRALPIKTSHRKSLKCSEIRAHFCPDRSWCQAHKLEQLRDVVLGNQQRPEILPRLSCTSISPTYTYSNLDSASDLAGSTLPSSDTLASEQHCFSISAIVILETRQFRSLLVVD